jgi:polyisoprenyl-teichoic acid--peptidoglycan teichoic acid transferase
MGENRVAYQGKKYDTKTHTRYPQQQKNKQPQGPSYGSGGQRPPGPPTKKRQVRWGRLLLVVALFAVVMCFTGLAAYGFYLERKVTEPTSAEPPLAKDQPVNVLLVGIDRDPHSAEALRQQTMNTDTLIVAHIDPVKHETHLLSIPRDTRVELPTGMAKINSAYAVGGMDRLKHTVEDLTTIHIDRYVMIDFEGFKQAVDVVGGVDFNVDKAIFDPEGTVSLQPGVQHLSGRELLGVVRFRHEEMGDIARVQRQQKVLAALLDKMKASSVLDWMKGMRATSDGLRTDMSISEMGRLATSMQGDQTSFTTDTVPGEFLNLYDVSYWKPDLVKLKPLADKLKK